jgi:hypothetical protein
MLKAPHNAYAIVGKLLWDDKTKEAVTCKERRESCIQSKANSAS